MKYNPKIKGKERILHAAFKTKSGYVVTGKCHGDCFWKGRNMGLEMSSKAQDQGFVTSKGRYVNREKAALIAKRAGQIDTMKAALISEDIWFQRERFEYSQTRGYFEVKVLIAAEEVK